MSEKLTIAQAQDIANAVNARQHSYLNETLPTSIVVVLLNYGDRFTPVRCIRGEWSGIKDDLPRSEAVPVCPNGHVLLESNTGRKTLGLIDDEPMIPEPPARDEEAIARAEQLVRSLEAQQIGVLRAKPTETVELHVGDRVQIRNNWGVLCHYRVVRCLDLSASTNDYADPPMFEPCPNEEHGDG